ncbi:DUF6884 domain-containing protein [Actinomadura sp. SCN-SB]|uniref:DUF6884 domain-containing protein n=1 Tax=Actinomadura sp. SCN-SB TaxID=3373092 RepID=UPI003752D9B8
MNPPFLQAPRAAIDPVTSRMVFAACSRRKLTTREPVPALDLYQGGCIPQLRLRLGGSPRHRARIWILSAQHGLICADSPILPYDRRLDHVRARYLRPAVTTTLAHQARVDGLPSECLIIAEPVYLTLLTDLLFTRVQVHWIDDVHNGWDRAAEVLDAWGWP